jgi:hypothetical protein
MLSGVDIPEDRLDLPGLVVLGHVVSLADTVSRAMQRVDPWKEETPWLQAQAP